MTGAALGVRSYALGFASLVGMIGPLGVAAVAWRRRLVGEWRGVPARLAEIVLTAGAAVIVAEVAGSAGAFRRWPMVAACVLVGVTATIAARPSAARRPRFPSLDLDTVIAVGVAAFAIARWTPPVLQAAHLGPLESDTLTYHLPHAARFLQDGWLTRLYYGTVDDAIPYHPQNGELFHAFGMLAFGRDLITPFVNVAWLAATLGAAWTIGRRWGAGALAVTSVAALMVSPLMTESQAGSAMTDVVAMFFVLAAAALLAEARGLAAPVVLAGLAAGLAVGSKLTIIVLVAVLAAAGIVAAPWIGSRRTQFARLFVLPMIASGGFWYVRNLARAGNPVPAVGLHLGPIDLYRPPIRLIDRYGFTMADYLFDGTVWRRYFIPGFVHGLGRAWPVLVGVPLLVALAAVVWGNGPLTRALGLTAVAGVVAYALTPTTALGLPHRPTRFVLNLRYLAPSLAIGAVLAPGMLRASRRWKWAMLGVALVALVVAAGHDWQRHAVAAGAVGALVAASVLAGAQSRPTARRVAAGVGIAVVLAAAAGYPIQRAYLSSRYLSNEYRTSAPDRVAFAWAQQVRNSRIGMAGFFLNYPLYGADLSNRVRYVGDLRADGSFTDYTRCADWRRAVDRGRYAYIVTMPPFPTRPGAVEPPMAAWTRSDPHAQPVLRNGRISVFRITGLLDPDACAG